MSTTLDTTGLDRVMSGLRKLGDFDATPLMLRWMVIIDEDNRQGILHGLDKDGIPMVPVKYRPRKFSAIRQLKATKEQRGGLQASAKKGRFQGLGMQATGLHGNLTSAEYRVLGGPPLAPREQFSRVVTNLKTTYGRTGPLDMQWYAMGYWDEVVSVEGRPFLRYHFDGTGHLPRRDLRGIRPQGLQKALSALRAFARDLFRQAFGGTP